MNEHNQATLLNLSRSLDWWHHRREFPDGLDAWMVCQCPDLNRVLPVFSLFRTVLVFELGKRMGVPKS